MWRIISEDRVCLREKPEGRILAELKKGQEVNLLTWDGIYAKVSNGQGTGYILASHLKKDVSVDTEIQAKGKYAYGTMLEDIHNLIRHYSNGIIMESIGKSEMGTEIPVIRIGNHQARHHILIHGAMHAREYMTTWLVMRLAEKIIKNNRYGDICWHMVPMVNPDGVAVSQNGPQSDLQREIYKQDKAAGITCLDECTFFSQWKANAVGTDINRNFPAGWELVQGREGPSSQQYKGAAPFSDAEAGAIGRYVEKFPFNVTISYHATGSVIYYEYGTREPANMQSLSLGKAVSEVTGYPLEGCESLDGAGFKDWAIDSLGIPSLTIEIGCGATPLAWDESYSIWERNREVPHKIAEWLDIFQKI